jgi:hypothetical protein
MRQLVTLGIVIVFTAAADARPKKAAPTPAHKREKSKKRPAPKVVAFHEPVPLDPYADDVDEPKLDAPHQDDGDRDREHRPQSFGLPWAGRLEHPSTLHTGERTYIRRPWRAYGTRSTVEFTEEVVSETLEEHPEAHLLAIGDISAEHGGTVTDHKSHQSGRDIDLGLFYKKKPAGYPNDFIDGTEANLDCATMWTMISKFAATSNQDGGVWAIFLDFDVQGILYRWGRAHDRASGKIFSTIKT